MTTSGLSMCALGAACMLAALAVDLGSTAAKVLMVAAAVLFMPGAYVDADRRAPDRRAAPN